MSKITDLILDKGGVQLFIITDKFQLNERKFASLLTLVTQKCLELLAINLSDKDFNLDSKTLEKNFFKFK